MSDFHFFGRFVACGLTRPPSGQYLLHSFLEQLCFREACLDHAFRVCSDQSKADIEKFSYSFINVLRNKEKLK